MTAGTIFVVILALAFVGLIIYLARLSRLSQSEAPPRPEESGIHSDSRDKRPPLKRAG
jgi:hypothetical protein